MHGRPKLERTAKMYVYRSKAGGAPMQEATKASRRHHETETEKLSKAFAGKRQAMSHVASTIRTLTIQRNYLIAQALKDGVQEKRVANACGETVRAIRLIGRAYDDLERSQTDLGLLMADLEAATKELAAATHKKATLEEERATFIAKAYVSSSCDSFDLALVSGITPQEVRNIIRRRCAKGRRLVQGHPSGREPRT
jgi:hypothetical protein